MIGVNLWDDYWDDDCVPEGENQSTYMYVESSKVDLEKSRKILEMLYTQIQAVGVEDIYLELVDPKVKYPGLNKLEMYADKDLRQWEIIFEKLSHRDRIELVEKLRNLKLEFEGELLNIYSES